MQLDRAIRAIVGQLSWANNCPEVLSDQLNYAYYLHEFEAK